MDDDDDDDQMIQDDDKGNPNTLLLFLSLPHRPAPLHHT